MVGVVQGRGPLSALSTWTRRCHRSTVHRPCALREEARKTWSMSYVRDPYNTLVDAKLSCLSFSSSPILSMNEHHFSPFLIPTTFDLAFPSAGLWHPFKTRDSSAMFPLLPFPVTKQKTNQMLLWNSSLRKKKYIVFIINLCSKDCSMLSANIYQQCLYLNSQGINFCKASHV